MKKLFAKIKGVFQPGGEIEGIDGSNFWDKLNSAYYKEFPEEWYDVPLYADFEVYRPILDGSTATHIRERLPNETVTEDAIWRAGLKMWWVGQEVFVTTTFRGPAENRCNGVVGKIRLVKITSVEKDDTPIAERWIDQSTERVQNKSVIARGEGKDILTFEVVE